MVLRRISRRWAIQPPGLQRLGATTAYLRSDIHEDRATKSERCACGPRCAERLPKAKDQASAGRARRHRTSCLIGRHQEHPGALLGVRLTLKWLTRRYDPVRGGHGWIERRSANAKNRDRLVKVPWMKSRDRRRNRHGGSARRLPGVFVTRTPPFFESQIFHAIFELLRASGVQA